MEYMAPGDRPNVGKILCCECGVAIDPNPANMCVACISTKVDITKGVPKQVFLQFCKRCERYLNPPNQWVACALESKELMTLCLKRLKGLNQLLLRDASFVWTEPHSRRIKMRLTVRKAVMGDAILENEFEVSFIVNTQMCPNCQQQDTKDSWKAVVQVRQRVQHKKTFLYLEQLILKHGAHSHCTKIKTTHDGIDFFFSKDDDARKLVYFFNDVVPCRYKSSKKLISHDAHNNVHNYKFTYSVEIIPICKNDIVCLPESLAKSLGGRLCLVQRVTNSIHLINPFLSIIAEVSTKQYWKEPFQAIANQKQFTEYTVINLEHIADCERHYFTGQGPLSMKHVQSDAWVMRSSDLGRTESEIHTRTHLGHLLKPGDTALGLDLAGLNVNNAEFDKMKMENVSDVVLVKKVFADKSQRYRKRKWKLKRLDVDRETETSSINRDFDDFQEDLEEDPIYRERVNIYKDEEKLANDTDDAEDDYPTITLEEMLEDLVLDDEMRDESGTVDVAQE